MISKKLLGAPLFVEPDNLRGPATPFANMESSSASARHRLSRSHEFVVRSRSGWRGALKLGEEDDGNRRRGKEEQTEEILGVVSGCREDIVALWGDVVVQEMLGRRKIKMEDQPGL